MLDWLKRLFEHHLPAVARPRAKSPVVVSYSSEAITVSVPGGPISELAWSEISSVTILTTDTGPFDTDLVWLITPRDRKRAVMVPMGAEGEHDLLQAMQHRLAGFDNVAVIEAMGSTSNASFTVWEAGVSGKKVEE